MSTRQATAEQERVVMAAVYAVAMARAGMEIEDGAVVIHNNADDLVKYAERELSRAIDRLSRCVLVDAARASEVT